MEFFNFQGIVITLKKSKHIKKILIRNDVLQTIYY